MGVPDLISNSFFGAIAAVELGCFKEGGLDATIELLAPLPKTMEALRAGELDYVAGAAHATLIAFPDWRGARILVALATHMNWLLVLRADLPAPPGDLHAVKGLRIGAAPGVDLALHRLLAEAGIDTERDNVRIGPVPGVTGANVSFGVSAAKALEAGTLDGFWANAMGAEVAVRRGIGTIVLDVRRDGPRAAQGYTFPAVITTERRIAEQPDQVAAVVRAIVHAQQALKANPEHAIQIGRRLFPESETELIAELVRRDLPYYDPTVSEAMIANLNHFAQDVGLLSGPVPYEQVVATQFHDLWTPR